MSDTPITVPESIKVTRTEVMFVFDPPGSFEQLAAELLATHNEIIKLGADPEQTKLVSVEAQKPGVKLIFESPLPSVEDEESSDD